MGATLTATASDGDITNPTQTFTVDVANEVTGVTWRWYRGGTEITDAQDNTSYTLLPADTNNRIRVVVRYQVDGNTRQEMAEETTDYPVLAARVGDNQLEFDPAEVSRTISEGDKGRNVGAPVTATGNHGTVRYNLSGTDSDQFEIDEKTGQITTEVVLNYEAASNGTNQCDTANSCSVTVTATDSTGQAATTNATVTIMLTDVDEKPAFSTGSQTVSVPENSTVLSSADADGYSVTTEDDVTYTAMDPEGRTVSYSLMGPDASKFQLSGSLPVLSFVSKPDFEAKASADGDNVYEVTVRASVGSDTGERMVRVTVSNVDEAPEIMVDPAGMSAPDFTTATTSRAVTENAAAGEDIGSPVEATDANGDTLKYTLGGTDAASFDIDAATGQLMTKVALDYETKPTYSVRVTATDPGGLDDSIDVTITVTDVDETVDQERLIDTYDDNDNGMIDESEVYMAIRYFIFGGAVISEDDVYRLIRLHIFGQS